jgi:hypothetical protein
VGGFEFERLGRGRRCGRLALRRRIGVGAGSSIEGKLAAVGDYEGLVLFGHDSITLSFYSDVGYRFAARVRVLNQGIG